MKKKKLKGMTLLEVIIAMVVMVICATLLVQSAVSVVYNTRTARNVISKVDEQASPVENRTVPTAYVTGDKIKLTYNGTYYVAVDKYEAPTTQAPDHERSGNMKYFEPAVTT